MSSENQEPANLHIDLMLESAELSLQAIQEVRAAIGTTALEAVHEMDRARVRDAARALGRAAAALVDMASPPEPQHGQYDEEIMFEKIVPPQIRRPGPLISASDLIEIVFEDDTTLSIQGRRIPLDRRKLFIFNQLTTHHKVRTRDFAGRLFKHGEYNKRGDSERRAIYNEIVKLRDLLGLEVIKPYGVGSAAGSQLSQAVYFTDIRGPDAATPPALEPLPESERKRDPEPPEVPAREPKTRPPALTNVVKPEIEEEESPRVAIGLKNVLRTERSADTRPWRPAEHIAERVKLPLEIVGRFIERNHSRLGGEFLASKRESIGGRYVEVFSPQFIDWAIASLERAKAREAERVQNLDSD
jgi:hypothetical protein